MMNRKARSHFQKAIPVTLLIVLFLIFTGSIKAINVYITADKTYYSSSDDLVTFTT